MKPQSIYIELQANIDKYQNYKLNPDLVSRYCSKKLGEIKEFKDSSVEWQDLHDLLLAWSKLSWNIRKDYGDLVLKTNAFEVKHPTIKKV